MIMPILMYRKYILVAKKDIMSPATTSTLDMSVTEVRPILVIIIPLTAPVIKEEVVLVPNILVD